MMANDIILRPEDMSRNPEATVDPEQKPKTPRDVTKTIRSLVEELYTVE